MTYKCSNNPIEPSNINKGNVASVSVCRKKIESIEKPILQYNRESTDDETVIDAFILNGGIITPQVAALKNVLTEKRFSIVRKQRIKSRVGEPSVSSSSSSLASISWATFTAAQWAEFNSSQWVNMTA